MNGLIRTTSESVVLCSACTALIEPGTFYGRTRTELAICDACADAPGSHLAGGAAKEAKYAYTWVWADSVDQLRSHGEQGWRLVGIIQGYPGEHGGQHPPRFILEKEVK